METIPHLDQLVLVVGVGVLAALVLGRFRLPTVAGLLVAGAVSGPYGLGLVESPKPIEVMAEVGVVLLLFSIGLEFSLARLRFIARQTLIGGSVQVGLTLLGVSVVFLLLGHAGGQGVFFGFLVALSSTAIVLRALAERGELDAPHGRLIVGVLVFQDLCVVPMMLLVPVLAGKGGTGSLVLGMGLALGKALVVVVTAVAVARVVVPRLFSWVDRSGGRDIFVLAVLAVCIGTAWLTSLAGLSMALGAFLAGLVLADTDYGHRAMSEILPLRDLFASVFFISLGMLFDIRALIDHPVPVLVLLAGFLFGKGFVATLSAFAMRFPARVAWLVGVGLAQFGEFGFVLVRAGQQAGLIGEREARDVLAAGVLSMFITPLLVRVAPHVSAGERLLAPLERLLGVRGIDEPAPEHEGLSQHVVIAGYGLGGRMLARALAATGVPYIVVELNAELVRAGRAAGEPLYYGDVTSAEAMHHARVEHARGVILLINDAEAARRAVAALHRLAPDVPVLMRTRYMAERESLQSLGASDVVIEELEAAMEMMARAFRLLAIPRNVIDARMAEARVETQATWRKVTLPRPRLGDLKELADLKVDSVLVQEGDAACGRSVATLRIRTRTGALVVAVSHDGTLIAEPRPHDPLSPGDVVFVVGSGPAIRRVMELFARGEVAEPVEGTAERTLPPSP